MLRIQSLALAACMAAVQPLALAADFPAAPIKLIVAFPPGGATDVIGRQIAAEMSKTPGNPSVVVENRPGAAGLIGAGEAARAEPDGYTVVLASATIMAADVQAEKMPFDPRAALAPVAALVSIPYVIVANPSFPPNNVKELVAAAKAAPGQLNFASSGMGSLPHMATELLVSMTKIDVKHIPYKGAVPAYTDVAAGRVEFITGDVSTALPFIKSGKLKPLATTGTKRLDALPNVPTVAESGVPGYAAEGWFGIFTPSKVPTDRLAALTRIVEQARKSPNFAKAMGMLDGQVMTMGKAQFVDFINAETKRRANLLKSNNIQLNADK